MEGLENNTLEIKEQKSLKGYKVASNVFLILALIAYLIVTAFMTYWLIDALNAGDPDDVQLALAFFVIFGVIIVGGIGYLVSCVFGLIGLIMTAVKRKQGVAKNRLILFIAVTLLPIITEIAFIVIYSSLA